VKTEVPNIKEEDKLGNASKSKSTTKKKLNQSMNLCPIPHYQGILTKPPENN
jgi:hypothetical protein